MVRSSTYSSRQGARLECDDLLDHVLAAHTDDLSLAVDARVDRRDRHDAAVEHGRHRAVDILLRERGKPARGVVLQGERHSWTVVLVDGLPRIAQVAAGHGGNAPDEIEHPITAVASIGASREKLHAVGQYVAIGT